MVALSLRQLVGELLRKGGVMWGSRGPAACSQDGIPGGAGCNQWQLESGEEIRVINVGERIKELEAGRPGAELLYLYPVTSLD